MTQPAYPELPETISDRINACVAKNGDHKWKDTEFGAECEYGCGASVWKGSAKDVTTTTQEGSKVSATVVDGALTSSPAPAPPPEFDPDERVHNHFVQSDGAQIRRYGILGVKRPGPVFMQRMHAAFTVETKEGTLNGKAGDWLVFDPKSTHLWPITDEYRKMHYDIETDDPRPANFPSRTATSDTVTGG